MLSNPLVNHTLFDNILAPTYMSFLTGHRNNTVKSHSASITHILSKKQSSPWLHHIPQPQDAQSQIYKILK